MLRRFFGSVGPCLVLAYLLVATAARGETRYSTGLEPFEIAAVHRPVSGKIVLGPTCAEKVNVTTMKLLVTAVRPLHSGPAMAVQVRPDGSYNVRLQQAYNYQFRLMQDGHQLAAGRYEPRYPDRLPRLVAQCPAAQPAAGDKPAAAH